MSETPLGHEPGMDDGVALYLAQIEQRQSDLNVAAITSPDEDLWDLKREIAQELDSICPYMGEQVYMSGTALMPDTEDDFEDGEEGFGLNVTVLEKDDEQGTIYGQVDGVFGLYQGCAIQGYVGEYGREYRIRHAVIIGQETGILSLGTRVRNETLYGFFEPDSTIQLTDEIEDSLIPHPEREGLSSEEVIQIIGRYSIKVVKLLNSSEFQRSALTNQQTALRALIEEAEQKSRIQDKYVNLAFSEPDEKDLKHTHTESPIVPSRHIYVPRLVQGEVVLTRQDGIPETLEGTCLGVESLEFSALRRRPIRRDNDLVDKKAGLSLVIDPAQDTTDELGLDQDTLVYVPVSGQNFDAIFS